MAPRAIFEEGNAFACRDAGHPDICPDVRPFRLPACVAAMGKAFSLLDPRPPSAGAHVLPKVAKHALGVGKHHEDEGERWSSSGLVQLPLSTGQCRLGIRFLIHA